MFSKRKSLQKRGLQMKVLGAVKIGYRLAKGMLKYPSDPEVMVEQTKARVEQRTLVALDEGGYSAGAGFVENYFHSGYANLIHRNHHGSHIDAPAHKNPDGKTIDEYLAERFFQSVEILDLTRTSLYRTSSNEITSDRIYEAEVNKISRDAGALLVYTGYLDRLISLESKGLVPSTNSFPYFNPFTIETILGLFPKLNILGIDSFSVDPRGSNSESHRTLFERDVLPLETICNLQGLRNGIEINPNAKKFLSCFPTEIKGGDTAPTGPAVIFLK